MPDCDITIKDSSIRRFLGAITFGLFFNEDVDVVIEGTDTLSGVMSVQYYRSTEILDEERLASLTGWTDYDDVIHESAEGAEKFVYYVKVTDNAGNAALFSSDGVTFDLTDPSITGVINGATYYTTQKVMVTDAHLRTVTLNGIPEDPENCELTLPGNIDAEYTITATDMAGNSVTVAVTMNRIASLADDIGSLTTANVTTADEKAVTAVKSAAANCIYTGNTTAEEMEALARYYKRL